MLLHQQPGARPRRGCGCSGVDAGPVRLPLAECDDAERDVVRRALAGVGALRLSGKLRVLPLGGLGEIGKNMTVVEYDGRIVVVDLGLRFPTPEMVGIDLVLPDFTYLRDNADKIEAFVITHGHEDHLGALPWVLRELGQDKVPVVYGGQLTIAMARSKLDEHKLREVELEVLKMGEPVTAGPVRDRADPHDALDPRRVRRRAHDRAGDDAHHRRLQVRPDAGRRRAGRHRRGSPSSAATASCCSAATPRTPTVPAGR